MRAEIVLAPHATGPPQHRHERHDEGFYLQYFRDLRELTAAGQPPSAELITDLMGRYATEPATGGR